MTKMFSATALLLVAGAANAAISGFAWRVVQPTLGGNGMPPGTDPVAGAAWTAGGPWTTLDLLVVGNVGDIVFGVSFGGDNNPLERIYLNGTVFNHPSGGNARSFASEAFLSAMLFDTYACFGGVANPGGVGNVDGAPTQFAGVTQLNGTGGQLQFTAFSQPAPVLIADAAFGSNGGSLRILRVTVTNTTLIGGVIGGNRSVGAVAWTGGMLGTFDVPLIPSPGAASLLLIAGAVGARRRR